MEKEENHQSSLPMSVASRLDRLDRLVHYLEEKQSLSKRQSPDATVPSTKTLDKQCKPLSTALDEVHIKGTLMERVAVLEKSVLQVFDSEKLAQSCKLGRLSVDMEEEITSSSSSSTIVIQENITHDVSAKKVDGEITSLLKDKEDNEVEVEEAKTTSKCKTLGCNENRKTLPKMRRGLGKWLGRLHIRCR